jgi:hypothetical protein
MFSGNDHRSFRIDVAGNLRQEEPMNVPKKTIVFALLGLALFSTGLQADQIPLILGQRERNAVFDGWLAKRLDTILPDVMRREKIDMWIVVSRENCEDPVFLSLVPAASFASWRTAMLVFCDRGKEGVERLSLSRAGQGDLYKEVWDSAKSDQWTALREIVQARKPKRIGINEGDVFAYGDGLTASLKRKLEATLGPEYSARFTSAQYLTVGWLERRLPEEIEVYSQLAAISHAILKEALSRQAITPGVTTTNDLFWWLWDRTESLRLHVWAGATVSIQRPKDSPYKDDVIRRGDLVHIDYNFDCFHLGTDTKGCAYILKEGETDVPEGLKKIMADGNRMQDILMGELKEGMTGNQILPIALKKVREAGITGKILAHPVGFHGHGAGTSIGRWDNQVGLPGLGDYPLYPDTCHAIELTATGKVPEWGNQEVTMELEEDAAFTRQGTFFLDGRQTSIILIK